MSKIKTIFKLKRIIIGLVFLGLGFAVFNVVKARLTPLAVATGTASENTIKETVAVSGFMKADRKADLSFGITTSKVVGVNVVVGDSVTSGKTLVTLNATSLLADVRASEAALNQAIAAYDSAKAGETITDETYNNVRYEGSARIEALKDQSYYAARSADDGMTRAKAALDAAKSNLANSGLVSPISGVVTIVNAKIGEIPSGSPVVQVVDPTSLYYNTLIDELDIKKIQIGQRVVVTFDAFKDHPVDGIVAEISPATSKDAGNNTVIEVKVKINNVPADVKLGMEGDADVIVTEHSNALTVPFESIVEEGDNKFVWVIDNGRAKKVAVRTGLEGDLDTEILEGLGNGQIVILSPAKTLQENQPVQPKI